MLYSASKAAPRSSPVAGRCRLNAATAALSDRSRGVMVWQDKTNDAHRGRSAGYMNRSTRPLFETGVGVGLSRGRSH